MSIRNPVRSLVKPVDVNRWPEKASKARAKSRKNAARDVTTDIKLNSSNPVISKICAEVDRKNALKMDLASASLIYKTLARSGEIFRIPEHLLVQVRSRLMSVNSHDDDDTVSYMVLHVSGRAKWVVITKYRTRDIGQKEMTKYRKAGMSACSFVVGEYVGIVTNEAFASIITESAASRGVPLYLSLDEAKP